VRDVGFYHTDFDLKASTVGMGTVNANCTSKQ
jgi:hypothetical protein